MAIWAMISFLRNGCGIMVLSLFILLLGAEVLMAVPANDPNSSCGCIAHPSAPSPGKLIHCNDIINGFEEGQERVKVIVNLAEPAGTKARTDWHSKQSLKLLQDKIKATQAPVLSALSESEFKLRYRFDNQAGFSGEVSLQGLEKLKNDPRVKSIEPVYVLEPHLRQGIPLMHADTYRSSYNGTGVAIAICDTGIDYRHPMLGNAGFPNNKVIGGYDYGDNDANPMPDSSQAHGTCCAGIAAGDLGDVGDYIGGVAYNARLYALKITAGSSGSATSDVMVAAWDWCVTHQNDDPDHPILVISTSFGGGRNYSTCDGYVPAMTTAANNAVAAGITVLASSGNDGYCDSIAWPSCISSVISVGAVYDAAFGIYQPCVNAASCATKYPGGCSTGAYAIDNTAADMVTSYSNTASFLTVLAPSNQCYTTDIISSGGYSSGDYYSSFGGTSAACPYTAGAVACLQSAAKATMGSYLSPSEVRTILTSTGDDITDGKVAITKPRVNVDEAINSLATAPPGKATEPNPADGAAEVGTSSDISWIAGSGTTSHDVYFGTVSPGTFRGNQTGTTYDPGALLLNTTYYWRIDEKNTNGTTTGDVWSFITTALPWSDDFESGSFTAGGWTVGGSATVSTSAAYTGIYGVKLPGSNGTNSMQKNKSTEGYSSIHVKYDRKVTGTNVTLTVDWSANGGNSWTTLETVSGSTSWVSEDWALGTTADFNPDFCIRFRTTAGSTGKFVYIDDVNITGTLPQYTISGTVTCNGLGLDGVTMGDLPDNPITGSGGHYSATVNYGWSGIVTPTKYAYGFEPNSRYYAGVNENYTGQDYTGILLTYRITGYIKNECNVPIENVAVSADNGGGQGTTDVNGYYEVWVDYNWSGTVTPTKEHHTFNPAEMVYVDVLADRTEQNYQAANIYDLDCDGSIGFGDLRIISENWLNGPDLPGDFYKDENDIVNFLDFAEFANHWLESHIP